MLNIAEASKKGLIKSKVKIVISNKKNSLGIEKAKKENIKTKIINQSVFKSKVDFEKLLNSALIQEKVNFICLAGYMSILSPFFLNLWNGKIINIHPSLLPDFRGKNAIKQALEKKVKIVGCTVHFVDKGVDTGEIIDQETVPVLNNDNEETLAKKILKKEHVLYIRVIKKLERIL